MKAFIAVSYHGDSCGLQAWKEIDIPFAPTPAIGITLVGNLTLHNEGNRMKVYWHVEDNRFVVHWRNDPAQPPSSQSVAEQLKAFEEDGWDATTWGDIPALEEDSP